MTCTAERHARIVASPSKFARETFIGIQAGIPGDPECPSLELRNCRRCNSTMSRPVEIGQPVDPGFGKPYGLPCLAGDVEVWMWRKGQRVRWYDAEGNQVGPEQSNVAPAMAYALSRGWRQP
jgi:hypothetical protein